MKEKSKIKLILEFSSLVYDNVCHLHTPVINICTIVGKLSLKGYVHKGPFLPPPPPPPL